MVRAMRTAVRWGGATVVVLVALAALAVLAAAVLDRPDAEPRAVDPGEPEVAAFLAAEAAVMAHHDLDPTEHVVDVADPGLAVRVLEVGDGPPVLVVPPAPGEAARLAPLIAGLDSFRFLLVNLPGGGGSDSVDLRAIDERDLALATLDAVYDHVGLDAAAIVASSRGGPWALWYGIDRPDRVTASIQLGAPALVEGTTVPAMLRPLAVPGLGRIIATQMPAATPDDAGEVYEIIGHPAATVETLPRELLELEHAAQHLPTYQLLWRSLLQSSLRVGGLAGWDADLRIDPADLRGIDHPTLLLWGASDPFGDPSAGREIAARLPDAELSVVGVGHFPWLDDPDGVAAPVEAFLNAQP